MAPNCDAPARELALSFAVPTLARGGQQACRRRGGAVAILVGCRRRVIFCRGIYAWIGVVTIAVGRWVAVAVFVPGYLSIAAVV